MWVWEGRSSVGILRDVEHAIAITLGEPTINYGREVELPLDSLCFLGLLDNFLGMLNGN